MLASTYGSEPIPLDLCLPHQPQFEGVHVAAALDAFVPGVVAHVIRFVWLEQVVGPRTIALFQETLQMRGTRVTESLDSRTNLLTADRTLRASVRALTLFLTRKAEHCRGTPISLWGFHVTEQALQPQHQHKAPDLQTLRLYSCSRVGEHQETRGLLKRGVGFLLQLPLDALQLHPVSGGHQKASSPRCLSGQTASIKVSTSPQEYCILSSFCFPLV